MEAKWEAKHIAIQEAKIEEIQVVNKKSNNRINFRSNKNTIIKAILEAREDNEINIRRKRRSKNRRNFGSNERRKIKNNKQS